MNRYRLQLLSRLSRDSSATLPYLVALRLTLLCGTLVGLGFWHLSIEALAFPTGVFLIFVVSAAWSLYLLSRHKTGLSDLQLLRELAIDMVFVCVVVWFTGRTANPFIYYLIVIVALGGLILPAKMAWLVLVCSFVTYTSMLAYDVQAHFDHMDAGYRLHLVGMWLNYALSAVITCFFVTSLTAALRDKHQQVLRYQEETLKNEQLIGLATVSASTVHNLATPLSTLTIMVDELSHDFAKDHDLIHDLGLMRKQIQRCQSTIKALAEHAQAGDKLEEISVEQLIITLEEHYALHSPQSLPKIQRKMRAAARINSNVLFEYALINLINNAMQSSSKTTRITFNDSNEHLQIIIENESDQSSDKLLSRWGKLAPSTKQDGLGIGSFLANSSIERNGGKVSVETLINDRKATTLRLTVIYPLS